MGGAAKSSVCTRGTDGEGMRCCALLVPATQHGAGCGVQFVEESGGSRQATRAGCDGAALRTPSPLLPHLRRERVRWGVALAVGSAPEAMEERVPSVIAFGTPLIAFGNCLRYTYLPSDARAVRSQRGDDVRAERCLKRCRRVGRDQTALGGVLGVHVVDFTWFLPNRETDRPRLESTVRVLARQRGVVVRSSQAGDLATVLGRRPRPLGVCVAPSHPLRLALTGARTAHFLSPAEPCKYAYLHKTCQHHAPAMDRACT